MTDSILNHPIINSRYFFPRYEQSENFYFIESEGCKLSCIYESEAKNAKTVVIFHGNAETVVDYESFFLPVFKQFGLNVLLAEFRGYSASTGRPALVDMLTDAENMIKHININPENLIIFGRSVGSIYAIHAASVLNASALIIESGISNVFERIMLRITPSEIDSTEEKIKNECDKYFNHKQKLADYSGKTLILHANDDSLVSVKHAKNHFEWSNEPKCLKIFDYGDHNGIFAYNQKQYIEEINKFLSA